ncbi:MAG: protein-glutamate O-methyltransferase CheR [Verrucomicrobia bacterium]|nr:protein-glutamate O-methyltransferase CheR [Verrucomicrobiota bacterium]
MNLTFDQYDFARRIVRQQCGIVLDDNKQFLLETRIIPVARQHGFGSIAELISSMQKRRRLDLEADITEALTTNETYFFRDVHPFDALKTVVLPELIKARSAERRLSIWCGASSTGQEPYSMAMLLYDEFPQLLSWKVDFIATDYSEETLQRAREGAYNQLEVNRGLPAHKLTKHFTYDGVVWRLKDRLRKMVQFRHLNLLKPWPGMPKLDLVFLRNVLIYFDLPTKQAILGKIRDRLQPDGFLFLGAAETTMNIDNEFQRRSVGRTSCYHLVPPKPSPVALAAAAAAASAAARTPFGSPFGQRAFS